MQEYQPKPIDKLKADYNRRRSNNQSDFQDFEGFKDWYDKQEKVCHYCGLREEEVQAIVINGILTSKRFPQEGKPGRGKSRGIWLEVDRKKPNEKYSESNCVLACYFCNNDKSDVFNEEEYFQFKENRASYLRNLIVNKK